jgi:hypothetical protein
MYGTVATSHLKPRGKKKKKKKILVLTLPTVPEKGEENAIDALHDTKIALEYVQ